MDHKGIYAKGFGILRFGLVLELMPHDGILRFGLVFKVMRYDVQLLL
jgi:hypothetical protein